MKFLFLFFAAFALLFPSGCSTTPKENYHYQQAIDSNSAQTTVLLRTLTVFDSGDVAKARSMAMIPVLLNLDSVRYYAVKGMATLTPEQRQEWTQLARETLDYMLRHRGAWDSRRLDIQAGMRGLRYFLTQPEESLRIQELSDYMQKRSETQKP